MPAVARAQQVISIGVGYYAVASEDRRPSEDVLRTNSGFQAFELGEFDNVIVGGEWMLAFGDHFEAGLSFEFYQQTVSSESRPGPATTGSDLAIDMAVRTASVPITARLSPLTRNAGFQPYIAGDNSVSTRCFRQCTVHLTGRLRVASLIRS